MFGHSGWQWLVSWPAMLVVALIATSAPAAPSPGLQGEWLTANGHGVVQITPCGDGLCGRIVGIDRADGEPMPTDVQGKPQCGLSIISADQTDASGAWHGEITDPRDGNSYSARLSLDDHDDLRLRVFIGIPLLGATQVWHRFTGHLAAECRIASTLQPMERSG